MREEELEKDSQPESTLVSDSGDVTDETDSEAESILSEHPDSEASDIERTHHTASSWLYYALVLVAFIILIDYSIVLLGSKLFWTVRSMYALSLVARAVILIIAHFLWRRRAFGENQHALFIISAWIGFVSGMVLAASRFIGAASFWTFLNLLAEPINSILLALFASFIVYQLTMHKPLKK